LIDAVLIQNRELPTAATGTTALRPLISEGGNVSHQIAPEQFAAARADEGVAAGFPAEPTTPAVVTGSFLVQHEHSLNNGKSILESAPPRISSRPANRARSAGSRHLQPNNSSPKGWVLPRRLTDGF